MAKVSDVKISRDESTSRDLVVTWKFSCVATVKHDYGATTVEKVSNAYYTSGFKIRWWWNNELGIPFLGSEKTVNFTPQNDRFTIPDSAKNVWVHIMPISKSYTVKRRDYDGNGEYKEVSEENVYFKGEWSSQVTYSTTVSLPDVPPVPSIDIENSHLTLEVNDVKVNYGVDPSKCMIQWQICQDNKVNSDGTYYINSIKSYLINNRAGTDRNVELGHEYKARCRLIQPFGNSYRYSKYSEWSTIVKTKPNVVPKITECYSRKSPDGSSVVCLAWTSVSYADSYDIEYTDDKQYFEKGVSSNGTTPVNDIKSTKHELKGLESGKRYYFRVRAKNEKDSTSWSSYKSVVLGSTPDVPTTWSSTVTAMVGEKIILYWTHNTEDGSKEESAKLWLGINKEIDSNDFIAISKQYSSEESKDTISSFEIDTKKYSELSSGGTIKWKVSTKGISDEWSARSIERTINVYKKPSLSVDIFLKNTSGETENFEGTIYNLPFYVRMIPEATNQRPIGCYIEIKSNKSYQTFDDTASIINISEGQVIFKENITIPELNSGIKVEGNNYNIENQDEVYYIRKSFKASNIDLKDGKSYTLNCKVYFDTGLVASYKETMNISWIDSIPDCFLDGDVTYIESSYSTLVSPRCLDKNSNPIENYLVSVYRKNYDGTFTAIAEDLDSYNLTEVEDPHPSLDYARYRIVATSTITGEVNYNDIAPHKIGCSSIILRWDDVWSTYNQSLYADQAWRSWNNGSLLALPYNIGISDSNSADVELIEYIGRENPVSYYGTQIGSSSTWTVEIDRNDKETLYSLRRLARWMGDVYVREPSGSGYWASINISFSQKYNSRVIPVTINVKRVEGGK